MTRFVALGDSITLGIGDPVRTPGAPGDAEAPGRAGRRGWRGWAALLAEGLPEAELHNLAGNGARIADVERDQLPRALQLRPDVASVVAGVNDTLRPNFDPAQIAAAAAHTVGALRAADVAVLTMRLPDPGRMLGMPGVLARPLARRAHEINLVMDAVAERFGTLHFDAAGDPEAYSPGMWAADRLHPSERGHRLIARRFHALLAAAGHQVGAPPDAEPGNPPPSRLDELAWLATKGTAWVLRRSTDLVPSLLAMAFREWWCGPDADLAGPQDPGTHGPQLPAERRGQPVEREGFGAGQPDGEDAGLTGFRAARLSGAQRAEGDEPLVLWRAD
ncbi:MAG TPA: SGNH/GDSL hydrolase family protein [Streptosporangiaceae bacterium]